MALVWHKHHGEQTPSPEQELPFKQEFQPDSRTSLCSQSPGSFSMQGYVLQIFLSLRNSKLKMGLTLYINHIFQELLYKAKLYSYWFFYI